MLKGKHLGADPVLSHQVPAPVVAQMVAGTNPVSVPALTAQFTQVPGVERANLEADPVPAHVAPAPDGALSVEKRSVAAYHYYQTAPSTNPGIWVNDYFKTQDGFTHQCILKF